MNRPTPTAVESDRAGEVNAVREVEERLHRGKDLKNILNDLGKQAHRFTRHDRAYGKGIMAVVRYLGPIADRADALEMVKRRFKISESDRWEPPRPAGLAGDGQVPEWPARLGTGEENKIDRLITGLHRHEYGAADLPGLEADLARYREKRDAVQTWLNFYSKLAEGAETGFPDSRRCLPKLSALVKLLAVEIRQIKAPAQRTPADAAKPPVSDRLRKKRQAAAREKRTVRDHGDRAKIKAAFRRYRKRYPSDHAAAEQVVKLCKWEKEEDNVLRLTESYMDLNADAVKRIAGVKR